MARFRLLFSFVKILVTVMRYDLSINGTELSKSSRLRCNRKCFCFHDRISRLPLANQSLPYHRADNRQEPVSDSYELCLSYAPRRKLFETWRGEAASISCSEDRWKFFEKKRAVCQNGELITTFQKREHVVYFVTASEILNILQKEFYILLQFFQLDKSFFSLSLFRERFRLISSKDDDFVHLCN